MDWTPLFLTFKLALITTVILWLVSLPIAYWLSQTKTKIKPIVEALIGMPLILPPTVLGFYLLVAFSPSNAFGNWLQEWFGIKLTFSFTGLVIGSVIYSLPFMVQPIQAGLSNLPNSLKEASYLLGKSKTQTFFKVLLPSIKPSLITGVVLTFAHTLGEFGVILMIGGNIPGETKVASIAIYDAVEGMDYSLANTYSLVLFCLAFAILIVVYSLNGQYLKRFVK